MKTNALVCLARIAIFCLVAWSAAPGHGATQLQQFTILPNRIFDTTGNNIENFIIGRRLALGEAFPEILPASQDMNGNWGQQTNGWQLSLRFRRNEFVIGEPVVAIAIMRNLEADRREVFFTNAPGCYHGFCLSVTSETNAPGLLVQEYQRFERRNTDFVNSPTLTVGIQPNPVDFGPTCETYLIIGFDKIFDFRRPGEYSVNARFPVYSSTNPPPQCVVVSGTVKIKIVEKLSTAGIREKEAWDRTVADLLPK